METNTQQVDELFAPWDKPDSPGCALAVMRDGAIIYQRGYGIANLEYAIPITPTTIFHVASVSKQFTAMAIALLADEGKLSLDDAVRKYIPELADFGPTITIRHLVHHTSGLRDQWELLVLAGWRMDDVITTDDVLALVAQQQELSFPPGDEYLYCNTGYTLMAVIVERVSGMAFRQFCAQRIFAPLKMANTHFHDDHREIVKNRAYSYAPKADGYQHAVLSYATAGATSLFTTVEDLAAWEENFYSAEVGGERVMQQMFQQGVLNNGEVLEYAFGITVGSYRGVTAISHSGGDAGYRSYLMRIPDHHFSVAILGNLSTLNPAKLARQVVDLYFADALEEDAEAAEKGTPSVLTPAQLAAKAGLYYNAQRAETYRLELRADKLVLVAGPGFDLEPLSEELFRLAALPQTKFTFKTTADGLTQFDLTQGSGKPTTYVAVEALAPSAEALHEYVGEYESPELTVGYSIDLVEGKLFLKRRKYGASQLLPTFRDGFIRDLNAAQGDGRDFDLTFARDEQDRVSGFRISTGRVRHLLFRRK